MRKHIFATCCLASIMTILLSSSDNLAAQSLELLSCNNLEKSQPSDFRFQSYITVESNGPIENMGDTESIESYLTCHFRGRAVQEFGRFFKQLVGWQKQNDAQEKQWRKLAMQKMVTVSNLKRKPGDKTLRLGKLQGLAASKDKLLHRRLEKDRNGRSILKYCHLLPKHIALRLAEHPHYMTALLVIGPICWKLNLVQKENGTIERVEIVGNPFGPWP